ncbi:MAG: class I SAM-dependent methyltransferase [Candidatus Aminicenantales bacterium]|jgi:cyclopropane-fatty-acyl-phospholipid synthase
MADQKNLDYTYTLIDRIFRFCFGETGDFSGAKYDGDFSLTLEAAQRRKHEYIAESLNIGKGTRVLDMGCGWGSFLAYLQEIGAQGIGVTLSLGQLKACLKNALVVHLMDCRNILPDTFGTFDAVTCIGAFEAFCSREEWEAGKQDEVYRRFFKFVSDLLPKGGRFYMQTMIFGKNVIDYKTVDIHAPRNSDAYICALMEKEFPGHWLPYSVEQIIEDAKPRFTLVTKSNGRLDYIETQKHWRKKFRQFSFRKYLFYLSFIPKYLASKELRRRISRSGVNANRLCFEREILDHYRLVFEKP